MRITKAWLRKAKSQLCQEIRDLVTRMYEPGRALTEEPELEAKFCDAFPYRSPDQRPFFAAGAAWELYEQIISRHLPDYLCD
jgi:hypothetical protein